MERLTGSQCKSLMEAYSAVYENTQYQLDEDQVVNEFMEFVDTLIYEGYDLSEYTYDELYEYYLNEGIGELIKTGLKAAWKIPQASSIRKTLAKKLVVGGSETAGKLTRDALGGAKNFLAGFYRPIRSIGEKHPVKSGLGLAALGDLALHGDKSVVGRIVSGVKNMGSSASNVPSNIPDIPSNIRRGLGGSSSQRTNSTDTTQRNIRGFDEEVCDVFDIIKNYLLYEGYANTEESAISIMTHMSEDWKNHILNSIME